MDLSTVDTELAHIRALVAEMKSLGVLHLEIGDIRILLGASHLPPPPPRASMDKTPSRAAITAEQLQFLHTEGLPDIPT